MSALALLGAALLLWPPGHRSAGQPPLPGRPGSRYRVALDDGRAPLWAAAVAALVAAVTSTPLVAVLAAGGVALLLRTVQRRRRSIGSEARLRGLAEALGALSADLRSGRPLDAATDTAVGACGDADTGRMLARALRAPGARSPEGEREVRSALDRIAAAVLLSGRTGCSLAAVVSAVEDDLRDRLRRRRELRSAVAAPRASALLLAGLQLLGLAMGSGVGADPWGVLTGTPVGRVLLVAGCAFEVAGIAWTGRLVDRVAGPR